MLYNVYTTVCIMKKLPGQQSSRLSEQNHKQMCQNVFMCNRGY